MGPECAAHPTDIGDRPSNFRAANRLKVGGNIFCHQNIHKWAWHTESQARLHGARRPVHRSVVAGARPHRRAA